MTAAPSISGAAHFDPYLHNAPQELGNLVGATIEAVWYEGPKTITVTEDEGNGVPVGFTYTTDTSVRLRVKHADGSHGIYELWADEEGNGPGYLAYRGTPDEVATVEAS